MSPATDGTTRRAPRRPRSATESLLSVVLVLDALLIFFVMLAVFGLQALPAAVAFGGGIMLMVVFVAAGRVLNRPWGIGLGWALQAVLVALGLVLVPMYFVGAAFAGLWTYCFLTGRRLDRQNAMLAASAPQ